MECVPAVSVTVGVAEVLASLAPSTYQEDVSRPASGSSESIPFSWMLVPVIGVAVKVTVGARFWLRRKTRVVSVDSFGALAGSGSTNNRVPMATTLGKSATATLGCSLKLPVGFRT